jgi:hypothetical protein
MQLQLLHYVAHFVLTRNNHPCNTAAGLRLPQLGMPVLCINAKHNSHHNKIASIFS